ncbi:MAG: sugar MFS transporter [Halococcoides sp.]
MSDSSLSVDQKSERRWTIVILAFVALSGLGMQMRGALIPELQKASQFGIGDGVAGVVAPAGTMGYVLTVLVVGAIAGRLDARRYVLLGVGVSAIGVLGMGLAPGFGIFLGLLVVRGLGTGIVRGLDRPILSHLYPEARGRVFNLYDLAWAMGAALGPALMSLAIGLEGWTMGYPGPTISIGSIDLLVHGQSIVSGGWRLAYVVVFGGFVGVLVAVARLDRPSIDQERTLDWATVRELAGRPAVVATVLALAFHTGLEGALFLWLPTFGIEAGGLGQTQANLLLSTFVVAYVPGRAFYTLTSEWIGYGRLVVAIEVLVLPVFAWTFFVADGWPVFVGVAVLGALVSGVFPTIVAFGTEAAPAYSAPINAVSLATGSIMLAVVPVVIGLLMGFVGIKAALLVPLAMSLAVAPIVLGGMVVRDGSLRGAIAR